MAEEPVANSCCAKWIAKRNALREAVKLLNQWTDQIEDEKLTISEALEEEQARVEAEKEARVQESAVRVELENEILQLKSEINYLWEIAYSREELLQTQISEGRGETKRLKELLEKEKKCRTAEKKKAESEKKKAAEAWKLLKAHRSKLDGEKQLMDKDLIQSANAVSYLSAFFCPKAANANVVFLEKQLELEKKHVQLAEEVANFEKRRNDLLQQEICRLKEDLQFCHRLNSLDGCFSQGVEGIDASAKGTSEAPKLPQTQVQL